MVSPIKRSLSSPVISSVGEASIDGSMQDDQRIESLRDQAIGSSSEPDYKAYCPEMELESTIGFFLAGSDQPERTYGPGEGTIKKSSKKTEEELVLEEEQNFHRKIGEFLLKNAKFRAAYSTIIERLKNDLIGRAAVASGYMKEDTFYEPPKGRGLLKLAREKKLAFFTTGSANTVTMASGLIGAACGITAVATSGLTSGASLALELVPIACSLITPVITTAIEIGGRIIGKIESEVEAAIFKKIDQRKADKYARNLAQAGSITHHDQLNMELAFGFVFLWQTQLEILTEEDAIKFANAWVDIYLKFIKKNKAALSNMLDEHASYSFMLEDLSWAEIPKVQFTNIFNSRAWEKYWLGVDEKAQRQMRFCLSQNFHSRTLVRKTGVRYKVGDTWIYWSSDPHLTQAIQDGTFSKMIKDSSRTRAWLYGYRTFSTEEQAKTFINLHTNHYLIYNFAAIRLLSNALTVLPAHVSDNGKNRIRKKEETQYVIVSDHLQETKETLVVAPAMQRFRPSDDYKSTGDDSITSYFEKEFVQPQYEIDELTYQYLELILKPELFPSLSRHQEQLSIEIAHLVENNVDSKLQVIQKFITDQRELLERLCKPSLRKQVTANLMNILIKGRMNEDVLKKTLDKMNRINKKRRQSPLTELIKHTEATGRLLFPCTIANGWDWVLYEVIIKKLGDQYEVSLIRQTVEGLIEKPNEQMTQERNKLLEELENEILHTLQERFKKDDIKCTKSILATLSLQALKEVRSTYKEGPISSGMIIAEYIRCQITGDRMVTEIRSKKTLTKIHKEHRRLMRYYHRIRYKRPRDTEEKNIKELIATDRDITWKKEENPIGPPIVEKVVKDTRIGRAVAAIF